MSIDCGAIVDGWHGDAAFTAAVGDGQRRGSPRLIEATEASLAAGIAAARRRRPARRRRCTPSRQVAEGAGFSVVREYTGHAIGQAMHEQPSVPNWGDAGHGRPAPGGQRLRHRADAEPRARPTPRCSTTTGASSPPTARWSAHVEHTIAITADGPEILTLP